MDELYQVPRSLGRLVQEHVVILQGEEVVHLDAVLPDQLVLTGSRVGSRLPSHCTALGKALLSGQLGRSGPGEDDEEVLSLVDRTLESFTGSTIVDGAKLLEQLRVVQLEGYAVDLEECALGLCCVAAPVRDSSARVVAALSLSGPSVRLPGERLHGEVARMIADAAARLSQELGSPL